MSKQTKSKDYSFTLLAKNGRKMKNMTCPLIGSHCIAVGKIPIWQNIFHIQVYAYQIVLKLETNNHFYGNFSLRKQLLQRALT